MTTFYLIRHGLNDWVDRKLAGWLPGVHLNDRGQDQVERLARRLSRVGLDAIVSSPLDRAQETAAPLAAKAGLNVEISEAVGEIKPGDWTGRTLNELNADEHWKRFNVFRGGTRAPSGELMLETQVRMVNEILRLRERYQDGKVAVVSHGDPLRAIVGYFVGAPIDMFLRLEISPASISVVQIDGWGAKVLCVNDTAHLADAL
jgi:probable phosphomutase (TIGR03848 family)